ncbi:GtrA family protein [Pseudomonas soli]|jgi:energy-converting hydrogenase Eha subunit C|uniref:GtrA family protein n=1 Tax=Pseudomonas soli TaxID=1306993 RepID=UPI001E363BA5|nr:GtrA family protein [Pseudomonas soli]WJO21959.1 GtrA family protein [Pseudomonas soli]
MENKSPLHIIFLARYLGVGLIATGVHYLIFLALLMAGFVAPLLASSHHLLVGMSSFICGGVAMVGEYVGVTLAEVKRRPLYFLKNSSKPDPMPLPPSVSSIEGKKF